VTHGTNTPGDLAHRIGIWVAMLGVVVYVLNIGAWVGAADEKFSDAETVEEKQEEMLVQQTTMAVKQEAIEKAVEDNKDAIEESRKEILAAIREAHRDD